MLTSDENTRGVSESYDYDTGAPTTIFEPPRSGVFDAIVRHRWLVILVTVALGVAGYAYGRSKTPIYTASATLQIGEVNPNSPGFLGYVQSAASLATAFSRSVEAEPVLEAVHRETGLLPAQAAERLSSSPIPVSPAFRVIATGPTAASATQLANAAAGAIVTFENQSNSTNPEAASLLHEYRSASFELRGIVARVAQESRHKKGYSEHLARAEAEQNAAEAKLRAIDQAYTNAIVSRGPSSGLVSVIAGATAAHGDRGARAERYALLGLLAGLLAGCLLALGIRRGGRGTQSATLEVPPQEPVLS